MIICDTGLPGSGKTTKLAEMMLYRLKDAKKIEKRTGFIRQVRTNIRLSPLIEKEYGRYIAYFDDIYTMPQWKDCDIFIDELSTYFDSQEWEKLPRGIKKYLRLHRHYNVNIYGIAQDFKTIDNSFRRLTSNLYFMLRVFGTKEPSKYEKPPTYPFIFTIQYEVDKKFWELEKEMYQYIGSEWHFFTRSVFKIFDTTQELPEQIPPPLNREVRHWYNENKEIGYTRTRYY